MMPSPLEHIIVKYGFMHAHLPAAVVAWPSVVIDVVEPSGTKHNKATIIILNYN